jgi:polar amino acid transport system substrate-binding protein
MLALGAEPSAAAPIRAATVDRDPFGFRDASGTAQGVSVDVFRLIASRLGRPLDVQFEQVDEISDGILTARVDLAVMYAHPELDRVALPIGPLMEIANGVLAQRPLRDYAELSGLKIGYVAATPVDARFDTDTALTKVAFATVDDAFAAYVDGSVDAIAGPLQYLFYQAPQYAARKGELFHVMPLQSRRMWLYVRTAAFSAAERDIIARAVQDMLEGEMIESFSDHYFGARVETR